LTLSGPMARMASEISLPHGAPSGRRFSIPAATFGFASNKSGSLTRALNSARSSLRISSNQASADFKEEARLIQRIFAPELFGRTKFGIESKHLVLSRVIHTILALEPAQQDPNRSSLESERSSAITRSSLHSQGSIAGRVASMVSMASRSTSDSGPSYIGARTLRARQAAFWMVQTMAFVALSTTCTIYALFGLDLVDIWGDKDHEQALLVINTAVFCFFVLEMFLHALAIKYFAFSLPALLDFLALCSLLGDTWFLKADQMDSQLARVARSSRMARLARIARIARVTRFLPHIANLLDHFKKRQRVAMIMLRRLWRVFLFLDTDGDKRVSLADLKCFYITIMQECPQMLTRSKVELLQVDVELFQTAADCGESRDLSWNEFKTLFLSTALGKDIKSYHVWDMTQASGTLAVAQKLSDRVSLKVCVAVLILLATMMLIDQDVKDESVLQGLAQLDTIARGEHSLPLAVASSAYLCRQIDLYARELSRNRHNLKLLVLDGRMYWDGSCLQASNSESNWNHINLANSIVEQSKLRDMEVVQACWSGVLLGDEEQGCGGTWSSMSLVDASDHYRYMALYAMLGTLMTIVLLVIFISLLSMNFTNFSKTLVQPLRGIADDMLALSSLELNAIDEAYDDEPANAVVEELRQLQIAFKKLRSAVRSWAKFVPASVVERLLSAGTEARIGVSKCSVSILFCDIDGFEEACHGIRPHEVVNMLSTVIGVIADIIENRGGTLLEFIGDEVLAVFNTPIAVKFHIYSAVAASCEIHKAMAELPPFMTESDYGEREVPIRCRCGLHTAQILAGNIGSTERMKYGLLGDGTNLTARLKGLNSRYGTYTLASQHMHEDKLCRRIFVFRPVDMVAVKGKKEPTCVYEVVDRLEDGNEALAKAALEHARAFELYYSKNFAEAKELFQQVCVAFEANSHQRDEVSRQLIARCDDYLLRPPPEDWDGVERLTKKTFVVKPVDQAAPDRTATSVKTNL